MFPCIYTVSRQLPVNKFQPNSLDFVVNRFFMKLFETLEDVRIKFGFTLTSIELNNGRKKV